MPKAGERGGRARGESKVGTSYKSERQGRRCRESGEEGVDKAVGQGKRT
jgi:hypothetical protein